MCENCSPVAVLQRWRSKDSVVLKVERGEHRDDTSIVGDLEGCDVLTVFCVERQREDLSIMNPFTFDSNRYS